MGNFLTSILGGIANSAGSADSPSASPQIGQLQRELAEAKELVAKLQNELESAESVLANAEDERKRMARLTDDMAASQARAASTMVELNRAQSELEEKNQRLQERDRELNSSLEKETASSKAKDEMFSAVTKAIEEITECLDVASTSCNENSSASRAAGDAADSALGEATEMSQRLTEIIGVSGAIRAVADRTRLLSLNAKIEASTEKVRRLISDVSDTTGKVNDSSQKIVVTAQRQEHAIEQLLAQIGELHGGDVGLF